MATKLTIAIGIASASLIPSPFTNRSANWVRSRAIQRMSARSRPRLASIIEISAQASANTNTPTPVAPSWRASAAKKTSEATFPSASPRARAAVLRAARPKASSAPLPCATGAAIAAASSTLAWGPSGDPSGSRPDSSAGLLSSGAIAIPGAHPCTGAPRGGSGEPAGRAVEDGVIDVRELAHEAGRPVAGGDERALHPVRRPVTAALAGDRAREPRAPHGRQARVAVPADRVRERAHGAAGYRLERRLAPRDLAVALLLVEDRQVGMGDRMGPELDPSLRQLRQLALVHHPRAVSHPGVGLTDHPGGHVDGGRNARLPQDRQDDAVVVLHSIVERDGGEPGRGRAARGPLGQLGDGDQLEPRVGQQVQLVPEAVRRDAVVLGVVLGPHRVDAVVAHVHGPAAGQPAKRGEPHPRAAHLPDPPAPAKPVADRQGREADG